MADPTPITEQAAARYAEYAMLASNCYHDDERIQFPVGLLHWFQVDKRGIPTDEATREGWFTGLAYDVFERSVSNESVIAFRGTDSKQDWLLANLAVPVSLPYKSALKAAREYQRSNPERSLTLVGHSLGGGLALGASVHYGIPAITFDPTPRIFDGLGDVHQDATRVIVYQDGEFLARFREKLIHKAYDVVLPGNLFECDFDFGPANAHRIDILAAALGPPAMVVTPRCGARIDEALQEVVERLPQPG